MPQIFGPSANTLARVSLATLAAIAAGAIGGIMAFDRSDYNTDVGLAREQPVQFSHEHHAGGLGIHCGYCHTSVEVSSFAGIPPTHTCMSCHSQIWTNSPMLEPVRSSYQTGESIPWVRIHDVPDFVFFNHSIHVNKGIGCVSCHGRVDQMPRVFKAESMQMQWCLDCHRQPEKYIRPLDQIYNMEYVYPANQHEAGLELMKAYGVRRLLDCYTCHR